MGWLMWTVGLILELWRVSEAWVTGPAWRDLGNMQVAQCSTPSHASSYITLQGTQEGPGTAFSVFPVAIHVCNCWIHQGTGTGINRV
ncbi:hypothetical protein B0T26DRAFT_729895 [Lasiosphaeria miniovina]|uniref:Uncharacterized protein n=1 Tax=Lasiosphaeria miniovina TaxID=1954250 RepID=A0AA40DJL1_9PEZI|nr:uncharacterized protein B0T26DRAFT_729895 [Lasiosphaeria miniovina]KAK0703132.1 hypothetical protein B0T26DRAFT_729895 [Lasiosphaeria miniovina]